MSTLAMRSAINRRDDSGYRMCTLIHALSQPLRLWVRGAAFLSPEFPFGLPSFIQHKPNRHPLVCELHFFPPRAVCAPQGTVFALSGKSKPGNPSDSSQPQRYEGVT